MLTANKSSTDTEPPPSIDALFSQIDTFLARKRRPANPVSLGLGLGLGLGLAQVKAEDATPRRLIHGLKAAFESEAAALDSFSFAVACPNPVSGLAGTTCVAAVNEQNLHFFSKDLHNISIINHSEFNENIGCDSAKTSQNFVFEAAQRDDATQTDLFSNSCFFDSDPFSPNKKANTSTPFSIKSAFKVKPVADSDVWSPFGKSNVLDFTKELAAIEQHSPIKSTRIITDNDDPFVTDPFECSAHFTGNTPTMANLLDETFDISGHDFSPTNSGCSSPSSEISNLSLKPDDFILNGPPSSLASSTNPTLFVPTTPSAQTRILVPNTPKTEVYKVSHPVGTLGSALYQTILSGGSPSIPNSSELSVKATPQQQQRQNYTSSNLGSGLFDEDCAKTPMSRYFAEKSCKLGGKLGELVDAEERPYFQTPKRDRYGRVVDMFPETPSVGERRRDELGDKKQQRGKNAVVSKPMYVRSPAKKPLYIRSPALGKARVNVKWDGGQLRKDLAGNNALKKRSVPAVTQPKPKMQSNVEHKTRRVATPVGRKPLYQPPPPRPPKPVATKAAVPKKPRSVMPKPGPINPSQKAQNAPPKTTHKRFTPVVIGSRHILHELTLPDPSALPSSTVPIKVTNRKSIYIPPPPIPPYTSSSSSTSTTKPKKPLQRTYIRLHNPTAKPIPFYISSTGNNGGTRDGKPCAFYSSFKFENSKGVVGPCGVLDVEVRGTGVLRGVYVQSFRVFAGRGSVPFTLRSVI